MLRRTGGRREHRGTDEDGSAQASCWGSETLMGHTDTFWRHDNGHGRSVCRRRPRVPRGRGRGRGSSYVNGSSGDSVNSATHGAWK
jgi:hypothetical protein